MTLSVVIPAYNEASYVEACLTSLLAEPAGTFHEIIVVDNASTDDTAVRASAFPHVRVVREERQSPSFARARGHHEASGDIIAFLDADTRIPSGWGARIISFFTQHPQAVALSGPAHYYDATPFQKTLLSLSWYASAPLMYRIVGYMLYGAQCVVRKSALDTIGGINTDIIFYGDDTDLARRLSAVGKVVFRMDYYIYSSARRFLAEGIFRTNLRYSLNFLWPVLFKKPFTNTHTNVRISK